MNNDNDIDGEHIPTEQPQAWLIFTIVVQDIQTPQGVQRITNKIVSWDIATKSQMIPFWKGKLGPGEHYLVPLDSAIKIENTITVAQGPLIKMN